MSDTLEGIMALDGDYAEDHGGGDAAAVPADAPPSDFPAVKADTTAPPTTTPEPTEPPDRKIHTFSFDFVACYLRLFVKVLIKSILILLKKGK